MAEAKRQQLKKVDAEKMAAGVYHAAFTDGTEFTADVRAILPDYDNLPDMGKRVVQYGLKQKLDDSMAGVDTIAEATEELKSTWEAIVKGQWTIRVPGEGVEGGLFARAYAEFHGIPLSDAKAKISGLVEKNLKANQEAQARKPKGEQKEITERMIFNRLRDVALEKDAGLKAKYEELKAKRATREKARTELEIETE